MPNFMLLLRGTPGAWNGLPEEEQAQIMERYHAFARGLTEQGVMRGGSECSEGKTLRPGPDGIELTAPSATERVTGYFLIEADDLEAAVAIARECPALTHGGTVEVLCT